jgi:transketolase
MRNAFADEITQLARDDERIVLLSGDIGNRLFDRFRAHSPERFFNCGVAEANMMGVAAGLAMSGYRPVVYTITPFTTTRCLEQIRVDVCYHNVPVTIVGTGSGLSYASLGPTHHSCEDMAVLRTLPNMSVLCPADSVELRQCLRQAMQSDGPVYMRIGKKGEPVLYKEEPTLRLGHSQTLRQGSDVCFVAGGTIMPVVLAAAEALSQGGILARVESFHTVKPLDLETLEQIFSTFPLVAVVEEHGRIGGLYGAIAEWQSLRPRPGPRLLSFGVDDVFLHEVGSQDYARARFGLTAANMVGQVRSALGRVA